VFLTLEDMRHKALVVERNTADCCEDKACAIEALRGRQSSTLKTVLGINAIMFFVELAAGLMSGSTALLSDSLANLGCVPFEREAYRDGTFPVHWASDAYADCMARE
jgi:hypothetical protein